MNKNVAVTVFLILAALGILLLLGVFQFVGLTCLGASAFGVCLGASLNLNPVIGVVLVAIGALLYFRFGGRRHGGSAPGVAILTLLLLGTILLVGLSSLSTVPSSGGAVANQPAFGLVAAALIGFAFVALFWRRRH